MSQPTPRIHAGVLSDVNNRLGQAIRDIERAALRLDELPRVDAEGMTTQEADEAADLREMVVQLEQKAAWASAKFVGLLQAAAEQENR